MDHACNGFSSAGQQHVAHREMPLSPLPNKCEEMIGSNEDDEKGKRLEEEIQRREKAIEDLDKRIKQVQKIDEDIDEEDIECKVCFEEPERLRKLPYIKGPTERERERGT